MALASTNNPSTPQLQSFLTDQHQTLVNLILMSNTQHGLFLTTANHQSSIPSQMQTFQQQQPNFLSQQLQTPLIGLTDQQHIKVECTEDHQIEHQQQQLVIGALNKPIPLAQPAMLERTLWELLVAKQGNALSSLLSSPPPLPPPPSGFSLPVPSLLQIAYGNSLRQTVAQQQILDIERGAANLLNPIGNEQSRETIIQQHQQTLLDSSYHESLSRNKLGRSYNPGRPLGMLDRQKILELYQKGLKISHIAKVIGVTHSCVSKIMTRYRRTGSIHPRSAQLSALGRRQCTSPPSSLPLPNQDWQWSSSSVVAERSSSTTTLKCSVPSAFHRVPSSTSSGERVSSDEEEREEQFVVGVEQKIKLLD